MSFQNVLCVYVPVPNGRQSSALCFNYKQCWLLMRSRTLLIFTQCVLQVAVLVPINPLHFKMLRPCFPLDRYLGHF